MPGKEKLINLFKRCVNNEPNACKDCPYDDCMGMLLKDIAALLEVELAKEQEPPL